MREIRDVASDLDIAEECVIPYGRAMAKVSPAAVSADRTPGKLVLVTAMTPTPAGEGKTTTTIGLGDALRRIGKRVCIALREPSLGPCFGIKGGGTGGGRAQLTPAERINLHFTGDFHAIGSAHNLLAAAIDNQLHFDNPDHIDSRRVVWPRVIDMNDRALRDLVLGLGGRANGTPRESGFDITAASELMAILCLADDAADLRARIDRTLVAFAERNEPVLAGQIGVTGAMLALLRDALQPNLVQTLEGTPALVHGGPFANIAHGCNSVIATRTALSLSDITVTEAGFGCDLGAEKFFDIKCRSAGLDPHVVVLVASCRALKLHGGRAQAELAVSDPGAVERGLPNLHKHIENAQRIKGTPVIALNRFLGDTDEEIAVVRGLCDRLGVELAVCEHFARGGEGAIDLAKAVVARLGEEVRPFAPLYELTDSVEEKVRAVATQFYGAHDVSFSPPARGAIEQLTRLGYAGLPVCIAKTPASLSDNPKLLGRPTDFELTVRSVKINAGAGFLVVLTGDILRMPGLPKRPRAEQIDLSDTGEITGMA